MRIVRVLHDQRALFASLEDDGATVTLYGPTLDSVHGSALDGVPGAGHRVPIADVVQLPVLAPSKVIGIGLNYRDHAIETGQPIPTSPVTFAVYPSSLLTADADIVIPTSVTQFVDYEAELGVVIGRTAKDVDVAKALSYVFGYTCVNDVSARDVQVADGQWVRAKSFDTFTPVGPWIVPAAEIADPQQLAISCTVNGTDLQHSSTREMIFSVAELVSFLSRTATLLPGDLIMTGTPPGVGQARDPRVRLVAGDTVAVSIESIGTLSNRVREV